jgi:threonine/homoserine/homoserine lactone efflux protein
MTLDHWLAFALASLILCLIPGPTVLMVVSYAVGQRGKSATAVVTGVALGDLTAMTVSMLGLGAFLATSAAVFTVLKWIGAAYLVYLGVRLWRTPTGEDSAAVPQAPNAWRMLLHAYAVTALNPKSIVFFVAFVPQFLVAAKPFAPQMAVLEATFILIAVANTSAYALLGGLAQRHLVRPKVRRTVNRTSGSLLIGAGLLSAGWGKASS